MHRSTVTNQPKSCGPRLTAITLIGGCLRKRNSAKQVLKAGHHFLRSNLPPGARRLIPRQEAHAGGVVITDTNLWITNLDFYTKTESQIYVCLRDRSKPVSKTMG